MPWQADMFKINLTEYTKMGIVLKITLRSIPSSGLYGQQWVLIGKHLYMGHGFISKLLN